MAGIAPPSRPPPAGARGAPGAEALVSAVLRDGIVLYEAAPAEAARWRSRALLLSELDRPWYERLSEAFLDRLAQGAS